MYVCTCTCARTDAGMVINVGVEKMSLKEWMNYHEMKMERTVQRERAAWQKCEGKKSWGSERESWINSPRWLENECIKNMWYNRWKSTWQANVFEVNSLGNSEFWGTLEKGNNLDLPISKVKVFYIELVSSSPLTVGRIMAPKDIPSLIPRNCKNVTLHAKGNFQRWVRL